MLHGVAYHLATLILNLYYNRLVEIGVVIMFKNEPYSALSNGEATGLKFQKQDRIWMLGLYGTAIGAGTLFLPINAGINGIWPLLIIALLAFPMTHFSHRALCWFVLSGNAKQDITGVVGQHFGARSGKILTFLYFFAIFPILLLYSVAITNTTQSFIVHQLGLNAPPREILSIVLILALMAIIRLGQDLIVKSMSLLVYPFIFVLLALSLYLIPYWNDSVFTLNTGGTGQSLVKTLWLLIPVMVFSFNHSPIISSFALSQKVAYGAMADEKSTLILKYSHILMVFTVMFFVFSCVFSLSPNDLLLAKQQNISILSYLANHFKTPLIAWVAPVVAFIAISKSFLGHYLGAKEGLQSLVVNALTARGKSASDKVLTTAIEVFIVLSCWFVATVNPGILKMIEMLSGPVIAAILFLMPMYAMAKVPAMKKYAKPLSNSFVTFIGLIAISAIIHSILF